MAHEIGHHAGMAAIAIGKRVDENELMMEPHGDFGCGVSFPGYPKLYIVKELSQALRNIGGINADVFAGCSVCARPRPDIAK